MKATELMIGDYVTVTPSGMLIQVAATHKRKVAYHTCTNKLSWVRQGLLRPILLTTEILEKNGVKPFLVGRHILPLENKEIFMCITPIVGLINTNGTWLAAIENGYTNAKITINYVHELQHTFRLCQIEKEIEL